MAFGMPRIERIYLSLANYERVIGPIVGGKTWPACHLGPFLVLGEPMLGDDVIGLHGVPHAGCAHPSLCIVRLDKLAPPAAEQEPAG